MPEELPIVVVGDVHGDLERLFAALEPYPPDRWRTVFLGDLVDGGVFGVGALRYARDRPNSHVVLGNHEVALLWALDDPSTIASWLGIGGQLHDLEELRRDPDLTRWLRNLPLLLQLGSTVFQHAEHDLYLMLVDAGVEDLVGDVNREAARLLNEQQEGRLWDLLSARGIFPTRPERLDAWLARTGATRVVHGHRPHRSSRPVVYHQGRAINFDGSLSRNYSNNRFRRPSPLSASVGPLEEVGNG